MRAPAPIEVTNWLIDIANGTPPLLIAQAFTGGAEHEANLVTGYYLTYLNRTPSQVEVSGWVSDIEAGLSNEDVIASFIGSGELYARSNSSASAWLDAAYVALFARDADVVAFDAWLPMLA